MRHRIPLLLLAAFLAALLPVQAQQRFRGGAARPPSRFAARPVAGHAGSVHRPLASPFGFSHFGRRVFASPFAFNYWYPGYYPLLYPSLPPLLPSLPLQYSTYIVGAEQPSPYWFPPAQVITGPLSVIVIQGDDRRVIGMGVPQAFQLDTESLGEVARRYREQAAQTKAGQRYVIRIEK